MIITVEKKIIIVTMVNDENDDHCWSQEMARQDEMVSKVSVFLTFCYVTKKKLVVDMMVAKINEFRLKIISLRSILPKEAINPPSQAFQIRRGV